MSFGNCYALENTYKNLNMKSNYSDYKYKYPSSTCNNTILPY